MANYKVVWAIDIEAETPEDAAMQAQAMMDEKPGDGGWVFEVTDDKGEMIEVDCSIHYD